MWLRKIGISAAGSLLGSAIYLYAPYTLVQIFTRGALREFTGMMIFPLVLYAITSNSIFLTSIVFTVFLLTDGVSVVIFAPILTLYLIFNKKFLVKNILSFIFSFLLSAFLYFPYIFERQYLHWGSATNYREHFVYITQLFNLRWGFGFSVLGPVDGMSFQIGLACLIALAAVLFARKKPFLVWGFILNFIVCILLMVWDLPWKIISPLESVQLPWRFLAPAVFSAAFLGAWAANKINPKIILLLIFFVVLLDFKYLRTNQQLVLDYSTLSNNPSDATAYHEFIPLSRSNTSEFGYFDSKYQLVVDKNNLAIINATGPASVTINKLYFPGWNAYIANKKINVKVTNNENKSILDKRDLSGLIQLDIPAGNHEVTLKFEDTPIRKVGKIISLLTLLFLIGKTIFEKSKKRNRTVAQSI